MKPAIERIELSTEELERPSTASQTLGDRTQQAYEEQFEKARDHRVVVASKAMHFVLFDDPTGTSGKCYGL